MNTMNTFLNFSKSIKTIKIIWATALVMPLLIASNSAMANNGSGASTNLSVSTQELGEMVRLSSTNPCSVYSSLKCYAINSTKIIASNNTGQVTFSIVANTKEAQLIALPLSLAEFNIESVKVNGVVTSAMAVLDNQEIAVFSPQGGQVTIEVAARIKNAAPSFTLTSNSGYVDTSLVSSALVLSQLDNGKKVLTFIIPKTGKKDDSVMVNGSGNTEKITSIDIEPIAVIERQLILDDKITLKTQVRTQNTPTIKTLKTILIDKIVGEQIISNSASLENDKIKIDYIPQTFAGYDSVISSNKIAFKNTTPYLQKIAVLTSSAWRVNASNVDYVQKQKNSTTWWLFPGQLLNIEATKIVGIEGLDSAVEKVVLKVDIKSSPASYKFTAQINSSVGSKIFLDNSVLSKDFDINQILLNGQKVIFNKLDKQTLILPSQGINNLEVELFAKIKRNSAIETLPNLVLLDENQKQVSSRNFHSYVTNFSNKWLLFAYGADIKPSILLWGLVIFILGVSYSLGKYAPGLGLGMTGWFLLLTGLTQAGFLAIVIALSWFVLLYIRRTSSENSFFAPVWRFNMFQTVLFILTLWLASALFTSVSSGLIGQAHVFIEGVNSSRNMLYFYNQTSGEDVSILWLPVWVYRTLMFIWSIWLAFNILKWANLFWESYSHNGFWKKSAPKPKPKTETKAGVEAAAVNKV